MKNAIKIIFPVLFLISLMPFSAYGGTTFTIILNTSTLPPEFVDFTDKSDTEQRFGLFATRFFSLNSEVLATGMAMTNTMGYPNGKSTIRQFPHMEFGVAAGAGVYKLNRKDDFNEDNLEQNPVFPGAGANGGVHFGTGITDRIDVTVKFFSLKPFYNIDKSFDKSDDTQSYDVKITDASIYSFGVKPRYNLLKGSKGSAFSFGGISVNLGLDYMYSRIAADVNYSKLVDEVDFTLVDPFDANNEIPLEIDLTSATRGSAEIKTNIISITPEIFVYADVLYFFSFYTGPSVSLNAGSMQANLEATGTVSNSQAITIPASVSASGSDITFAEAGEEIGSAVLVSRNKMTPERFIPRWTLGLEMNIWAFKIQLEAATVLTSITESFTGQVGLRVDF